jgi:hypothetical protein
VAVVAVVACWLALRLGRKKHRAAVEVRRAA